jgi:hypothetical protein
MLRRYTTLFFFDQEKCACLIFGIVKRSSFRERIRMTEKLINALFSEHS